MFFQKVINNQSSISAEDYIVQWQCYGKFLPEWVQTIGKQYCKGQFSEFSLSSKAASNSIALAIMS